MGGTLIAQSSSDARRAVAGDSAIAAIAGAHVIVQLRFSSGGGLYGLGLAALYMAVSTFVLIAVRASA